MFYTFTCVSVKEKSCMLAWTLNFLYKQTLVKVIYGLPCALQYAGYPRKKNRWKPIVNKMFAQSEWLYPCLCKRKARMCLQLSSNFFLLQMAKEHFLSIWPQFQLSESTLCLRKSTKNHKQSVHIFTRPFQNHRKGVDRFHNTSQKVGGRGNWQLWVPKFRSGEHTCKCKC